MPVPVRIILTERDEGLETFERNAQSVS